MLSPALAALQAALNHLLISAAIVLIAVVVALCWLGARNRRRWSVEAAADASPGSDSDYAPETPVAARTARTARTAQMAQAAHTAQAAQRTNALPATAVLPMAADLLVVDDSAVARAKLRRLFANSGYEVHLARDGVEALALLQKGRYRMMITDLEMPNLDGVELICTCQAQAHTADMPVLAITGHEDLQARLNECQEICGIYRKPWIDEDLTSHVALLISHPAIRQAEAAET